MVGRHEPWAVINVRVDTQHLTLCGRSSHAHHQLNMHGSRGISIQAHVGSELNGQGTKCCQALPACLRRKGCPSTCLVRGPCAAGASSAEFEAGQSGGWSLHRQCRSPAHCSPAASWALAHGAARPPKPLQPPAPAPGLATAQARAHKQFESSKKTAAQLQPTATLAAQGPAHLLLLRPRPWWGADHACVAQTGQADGRPCSRPAPAPGRRCWACCCAERVGERTEGWL